MLWRQQGERSHSHHSLRQSLRTRRSRGLGERARHPFLRMGMLVWPQRPPMCVAWYVDQVRMEQQAGKQSQRRWSARRIACPRPPSAGPTWTVLPGATGVASSGWWRPPSARRSQREHTGSLPRPWSHRRTQLSLSAGPVGRAVSDHGCDPLHTRGDSSMYAQGGVGKAHAASLGRGCAPPSYLKMIQQGCLGPQGWRAHHDTEMCDTLQSVRTLARGATVNGGERRRGRGKGPRHPTPSQHGRIGRAPPGARHVFA